MGEILMAAFDATDSDKAKAWIVCDGFDDQIEIQTALDEWPKIKPSTGTFGEMLDRSGDDPWAV